MKRKSYIYFIMLSWLVLVSNCVWATGVVLEYDIVPEKLYYESKINMESMVHTGQVNVSTKLDLTISLQNQITTHEQQMMFKLTFMDVNLDEYERDVQIKDHNKRSVGSAERENLDQELERLIPYKWINLVLTEKGELLEKYHSISLDQFNQIDLTRLAEGFIVRFPETPLRVGDQWQDSYYSMLPPYDQVKPFSSIIKYTYLGKEDWNDIQCNKVKVLLVHQEEGRFGTEEEGITRINQIITGNMYFAIEGQYLVYSELLNDLTMLVAIGDGEIDGYRNLIRTRLGQTIELVSIEEKQVGEHDRR